MKLSSQSGFWFLLWSCCFLHVFLQRVKECSVWHCCMTCLWNKRQTAVVILYHSNENWTHTGRKKKKKSTTILEPISHCVTQRDLSSHSSTYCCACVFLYSILSQSCWWSAEKKNDTLGLLSHAHNVPLWFIVIVFGLFCFAVVSLWPFKKSHWIQRTPVTLKKGSCHGVIHINVSVVGGGDGSFLALTWTYYAC